MRPPGAYRFALVQALASGPATSRDAAARACMSVDAARSTLDNMRRGGHVTVASTARVEGVKRPVPVYALAEDGASQAQAPPEGEPFADAQFPPVYWWANDLTE